MRDHLTAHYRGKIVSLPLEVVTHFRSGGKYVTAHHAEGEFIITDTLNDLEAELAQDFIRSHRSFLVRKSIIQGFTSIDNKVAQVSLLGVSGTLPVSETRKKAVKKIFTEVTSCNTK